MSSNVATRDQAIRFDAFGAPSVLQVVERELPEPGPGQVRIRVEASSVQYTDTLIRRGVYPDLRGKPPFVPGYDVVGIVDAVGAGVTAVRPGQRVADLCQTGGNADHIVRPASGLVVVPDGVDPAEAVTLVLSWMTAWQCLHRVAKIEPGQRLLVIGGNGSVGQALVQLGVLAGAEVYATARDRFHEDLRRAGALPLDRDGGADAVRGTCDVVVDGVGVDAFRPSYRALRRGGRLVAIGLSSIVEQGAGTLRFVGTYLYASIFLDLWPDGRRSSFYSIASVREAHPDWWSEDLGHLFTLLGEGRIRVAVGERIGLDDVGEAHARLERGGLSGKIVLEPHPRGTSSVAVG